MWAAAVKKGLNNSNRKETQKETRTAKCKKSRTKARTKATQRVTGGGGGGTYSSMWKNGRGPVGNGKWVDGEIVHDQEDFKYRRRTNSAGVQQCMRQDGRIAVLTSKNGTYTTQFRSYNRCRHKETEEEFQKRVKTSTQKRVRMTFCPELVDIVLEPTLTNDEQVTRLYNFVMQNYPGDTYRDSHEILTMKYGTHTEIYKATPGETAKNLPKYSRYCHANELFEEPYIHSEIFDLKVTWLKLGVKFKITEDHEYGCEYIITDEDFDSI